MKINEKENGIDPYFQKRFENYSISLSLYFSLTFLFDLLRCNFVLIFQTKNGPSPASFLFIFGLFQANIHTIWQQINVKKCPSSIWHWDSNPRSSELLPWPLDQAPAQKFIFRRGVSNPGQMTLRSSIRPLYCSATPPLLPRLQHSCLFLLNLFLKMGQSRPLFCSFSFFSNTNVTEKL